MKLENGSRLLGINMQELKGKTYNEIKLQQPHNVWKLPELAVLENIKRGILAKQVLNTRSRALLLQLHLARVPCSVDLATVTAPKEVFLLHSCKAADHRTFSLAQGCLGHICPWSLGLRGRQGAYSHPPPTHTLGAPLGPATLAEVP